MSLLADEPLTRLAFALHENRGVFALLLGSGISRAADVPTGWEITLDLIRRVAEAQGVSEQPDWEAWYRRKTGQEPNYSNLLEELASSPEERRAILHRYIEPTTEEREAGRKQPTAAHRAIAKLVASGHIRVIVTTNFDRLIESALRDAGVEPTVVASVDALAGAEPLTHTRCYVLKLHGDYKDARIRNTDAEIDSYPAEINALLDRILDEHGLIVCGWSGEWDHALRNAFLRAPNRRYSVFWAARGTLGERAAELVRHRRAQVIPISDADSFFSGVQQRVATLERSRVVNPRSVELLVNTAKRFLARPEHAIELHDLVAEETARLIRALDEQGWTTFGVDTQEGFRTRISTYDAMSQPLAALAGALGRWGAGSDLRLVLDVIRNLAAHGRKEREGSALGLRLRFYPAVLCFTAYGLGLTRAERWRELHALFDAQVAAFAEKPGRLVERLFLGAWMDQQIHVWRQIDGLKGDNTALSDHLLRRMEAISPYFLPLTPDISDVFQRFEMLGSLAHLERYDLGSVKERLAGGGDNSTCIWMPVGRAAWNERMTSKLLDEMQAPPLARSLMDAGFARKDENFLQLYARNLERIASRYAWM